MNSHSQVFSNPTVRRKNKKVHDVVGDVRKKLKTAGNGHETAEVTVTKQSRSRKRKNMATKNS